MRPGQKGIRSTFGSHLVRRGRPELPSLNCTAGSLLVVYKDDQAAPLG